MQFLILAIAHSLLAHSPSVTDSTDRIADSAWARLQHIADDHQCPGYDADRAGWLVCHDRMSQAYRIEGLRFYDTYPDDPRRWAWLVTATWLRPNFYADPAEAAQWTRRGMPWRAQIDTAARHAHEAMWEPRFRAMKDAILASPQATASEKNQVLYWESYLDVFALNSAIHRNDRSLTVSWVGEKILSYAQMPFAEKASGVYNIRHVVSVFARDPMIRRSDSMTVDAVLARLRNLPLPSVQAWLDGDRAVRARRVSLRGGNLHGTDTLDVASLRGHVVVLDFWNMGCTSCVAQWPSLKALAVKYGEAVRFMGVVVQGDDNARAQARVMTERHGLPWPEIFVGRDVDALFDTYGFYGAPYYAVLDTRGYVVALMGGPNWGEIDTIISETLHR